MVHHVVEEDRYFRQTIIFMAFVVVLILAALTASLPINEPDHQVPLNEQDLSDLNAGDTAWVIVATVLGIFLAPAVSYLYGTMYGNNISEMLPLILVVCSIISFLWIIVTFSLSYGNDVNGDRIYGLPTTYVMFRNTYAHPASRNEAGTIPISIFAVYELGFALVTPCIILSSIYGRITPFGFILFIMIWHVIVYCPYAHMMWHKEGWFRDNEIEDFSGGMVVHMLASLTAVCAHVVLGRRDVPRIHPVTEPSQVLKLTMIVFFLWFGFNSGKAHSAGPVAAQSIVNTIAATCSSVVTSFLYDLMMERESTPVSISCAVLIGLISISPGSGFVAVGGAFIIGMTAYLTTAVIATQYLNEAKLLNQPFSIVTMHGIAGMSGFLWTAVFSYKFINDQANNGLAHGNGTPLGMHVVLVCLFYAVTVFPIMLILLLCDYMVPLAVFLDDFDDEDDDPKAKDLEKSVDKKNLELVSK